MGSYRDNEFEQNMDQLINILKRIVKNQPDQDQIAKLQSLFKKEGINLNFCFFNFFPVDGEEMDELEEIFDQFLFDDNKTSDDLSTDLNRDDLDFLKRHGIQF